MAYQKQARPEQPRQAQQIQQTQQNRTGGDYVVRGSGVTFMSELKNDIYEAVRRYFAPIVAIYGEFEKSAGMPTAWQRRKLDDDTRRPR